MLWLLSRSSWSPLKLSSLFFKNLLKEQEKKKEIWNTIGMKMSRNQELSSPLSPLKTMKPSKLILQVNTLSKEVKIWKDLLLDLLKSEYWKLKMLPKNDLS